MRGFAFLGGALLVTLAGVLLPYLLYTDVPRFSGAYLFWSLTSVIAIVAAALLSRNWGGDTSGEDTE